MSIAPIVALEIGTSKVVAVVGEMRGDGNIVITGVGEHESTGIRKGEVVDPLNAAVCVRAAVGIAEETSKVEIGRVHVCLSGGHIQAISNRGEVPVFDPAGTIGKDDVDGVMQVAEAINLPPDREMLHSICQHFSIDNQEDVIRPEGLVGAKLALNMLLIHGVRARIYNVINVVKSIPFDVSDAAFSGLCSSMAVTTHEQRLSGVVVIDMGGGTTDYVVHVDGVMAAAGAFGVGGDHVTNDVALAFKILNTQAEKLKREAGSAIFDPVAAGSRSITLPSEGGFHGSTISVKSLHAVINARLDETFVMIRKRLEKENLLHHIGAGVILTGGGSRMKDSVALAEKVFDLPCSIGRPINVSGLAVVTDGPEYAACCGLIQYGFQSAEKNAKVGFMDMLKNIFGR